MSTSDPARGDPGEQGLAQRPGLISSTIHAEDVGPFRAEAVASRLHRRRIMRGIAFGTLISLALWAMILVIIRAWYASGQAP